MIDFSMRLPKNVRENLFFLIAEIQSQVSSSQVFLDTRSISIAQRILDRRGYSYNLKMRIYDSCVECLRHGPKGSISVFSLRSAEAIASELERIGHLCFECVHLTGNIKENTILTKSGVTRLLDVVLHAISLIEKALDDEDTKIALKIGNIKQKLERLYHHIFKVLLKELHKNKKSEDIITALFIAKRIEEMGGVILSISEAIMSAKYGQPMHIDRFRSLKTAMSDLGLIEADVEVIAQTKSGSGISAISDPTIQGNGYAAIFKDGTKEKLKEERDSVENWHEIFPGLAPQIISYNKQGKNASLLIEHLSGMTFDKVLINETDENLQKALKTLIKTLKSVWKETKRKDVFAPNHMHQLRKRLDSVLEIHPNFKTPPLNICGVETSSLTHLIDQAEALENKVTPLFSVYIHGDFNLDNIIYDVDMKKIKFIDLHRSCYQDYTQDISVFMISNFRLQVFKKETRQRITLAANTIYEFAAEFAQKQNDKTFDFRLALGLARSFITSTRFILDAELANAMFLRAVFILEKIVKVDQQNVEKFKLPIKELFS
jgi:phosphate uptake regulator/aminoglycoside phosphotransferase